MRQKETEQNFENVELDIVKKLQMQNYDAIDF